MRYLDYSSMLCHRPGRNFYCPAVRDSSRPAPNNLAKANPCRPFPATSHFLNIPVPCCNPFFAAMPRPPNNSSRPGLGSKIRSFHRLLWQHHYHLLLFQSVPVVPVHHKPGCSAKPIFGTSFWRFSFFHFAAAYRRTAPMLLLRRDGQP